MAKRTTNEELAALFVSKELIKDRTIKQLVEENKLLRAQVIRLITKEYERRKAEQSASC